MELTTTDIQNHIIEDPAVSPHFLGVHPSDSLAHLRVSPPASLIVNLDPHYLPGSHWVAIFIPRYGHAAYFDSLGMYPMIDDIIFFLDTNSRDGWCFNPYMYQDLRSVYCGYYAMAFIKLAHRDFDLTDFDECFIRGNGPYNDYVLLKYLKAIKEFY